MEAIIAARTAVEAWGSVVGSAVPEPMRGQTNRLWRVDARAGRAYVLKQLPEFPPGVGPVEEFRVLAYLQTRQVPVAAPIVTDAGGIYTLVGQTRYALLPLLPNDPGNHELGPAAAATCYAVGGAIAALDEALATCPWRVKSFVDDPARQLVDEWLPGLPAELTQLVLPLKDRLWDATVDLPTQRTHGDCNTGNVLVYEGQVSGFIDLDHLPISPRVRDLPYYLASRICRHLAVPDPADRERATRAWTAALGHYVSGYHDTYPLSERERAAVIPLVLMVHLSGASWCLHGWTPNPEGYEQDAHATAWTVDHFDELVAAARPG